MLHQFIPGHATTDFDQDRTLVVVVEMSQSTWLVTGLPPGLERLRSDANGGVQRFKRPPALHSIAD
jgi:hypothetical protein